MVILSCGFRAVGGEYCSSGLIARRSSPNSQPPSDIGWTCPDTHMYIFTDIDTRTDGQTGKQTDRPTDREADR